MELIKAWVLYFYRMGLAFLSHRHGRKRLFFGFCPICNSDAPELYDCPMCGGYHSARGDKFPPPKEMKIKWLCEFQQVYRMKKKTLLLVRDSRIKRALSEKPANEAICPVCGYYCLGSGGMGCIDKPSMCDKKN